MGRTLFQGVMEELKIQADVLQKFSQSRLARASAGSIFVGAGDSYAAAIAGFYASQGRCVALDPYSLASNPEVAEGVDVFLISVSGRTSSNLAAARAVKGVAGRTTAITADGASRLASLTDDTVTLPTSYAPRSPGMLSFSLSLLAVMKLAAGEGRCDFRAAFARAERDSGKIAWGRGTTYFLGNLLGYPAALYAAAKTYEFLGTRAHPELMEEFSHMELFSLAKADVVNIFSCFDPFGAARKLRSALAEQGYEVHVVPSWRDSVESLFHAVFVIQLSTIAKAKKAKLSKPSFLSAGGRLRVSDRMIY